MKRNSVDVYVRTAVEINRGGGPDVGREVVAEGVFISLGVNDSFADKADLL